jgi:tRNA (cmo5U34)-methyltransferase
MKPKSSLGHRAGPRWEFDADVTQVFDDMLRRSIPQYEEMRHLVGEVGRPFVQPFSDVVDLGCSQGEALAPFVDEAQEGVRYTGIEVSPPMLEAARRRFEREINAGFVQLLDLDLRNGYPSVAASLTLSVLTLQFTPLEQRLRILSNVFEHTVPGGALVLVEKVLGNPPQLDELFVTLYYHLKQSKGYPWEEIERKRLSLEGVLVPVTAHRNEALLREAGFGEVECFWRWLNFAGWVAIKRSRWTDRSRVARGLAVAARPGPSAGARAGRAASRSSSRSRTVRRRAP